ncbi:hypothetical protein P20652_3301 [Pseudoalteromonas sp. BSi20652]|nr:hypothetical protein P20652_3301 [Pseudoalteromonas sp. BSi20652]
MIYAKNIQHFIEPEKWQVTPQTRSIHYDALIQNVEMQTETKSHSFLCQNKKRMLHGNSG